MTTGGLAASSGLMDSKQSEAPRRQGSLPEQGCARPSQPPSMSGQLAARLCGPRIDQRFIQVLTPLCIALAP